MAYPQKKTALSYETILRDVKAGNFKPVYYLMGAESYYIDRVADYIVDVLLKPEERDFNLITLFGSETTIDAVIDTAKGFPMGAQRLVVLVKEAQNIKDMDRLDFYLRQPQASTVLIFCHKNGTLDRRKKVVAQIERVGVLYESAKLRDYQLPNFITSYLKRKGVGIDGDALSMIAQHVGPDLNRMAGELDKICIALPEGQRSIDRGLVADNIGISREFNIFELQDAFSAKDAQRVMQIANYFDKNPKANPIQMVLPSLFRYFSNIMLAYYSPGKTEQSIAEWLGLSAWQVRKNVMPAMSRYSGIKVMNILSEIRRTDARSKGIGNPATSDGDLMRELFFYILH